MKYPIKMVVTDLDGTLIVAEAIRKNVEGTTVPCSDGTLTSVTISLGAGSVIPDVRDSAADFISIVDTFLYAAKRNGRNQVCWEVGA